jgi:glycosyltransferase involved in cell wall biosynthesis
MVQGKKVVVVLPAYNAAKTLLHTYKEIPLDLVDEVILVDDASTDHTAIISQELKIKTIVHKKNSGYGANQKSCYAAALDSKADIVIMLHPDYQYTPKLIGAMIYVLLSGEYDLVLGSRILGGKARQGGMPFYKYVSNRFLTLAQNLLMGAKLSEYHTGYRAYTQEVLQKIPWQVNSNDFVFDNQFLSQAIYAGFRIGEVTCPTKYFAEASSINFMRSMKYGIGCLRTACLFRLQRMGIAHSKLFSLSERTPAADRR